MNTCIVIVVLVGVLILMAVGSVAANAPPAVRGCYCFGPDGVYWCACPSAPRCEWRACDWAVR